MRRVTPFQRDFEELHGRATFRRAEVVDVQPRQISRGAALVIGGLSLFWVLVLSVVVIVMIIVGGVFAWSALTAPPL